MSKSCLRCSFIHCICNKTHTEPRCECGHGLGIHGKGGCGAKNGHDEYCSCMYVPLIIRDAIRADIVLAHSCKTHPRYQAKRSPRTTCEGCWRLWFKVHP